MKAFRYNSKKRSDRQFNTTGIEKNPNAIKYYATNLEYANNYKYIYGVDGEVIYECTLEVVNIENVNLFDMANEFKSLNTYNEYIAQKIGIQMRDYTRYLNNANKASERKMWQEQIEELKVREIQLISTLINTEFQSLSDYDLQNSLVAELKSKGFDGYYTKNEIAII